MKKDVDKFIDGYEMNYREMLNSNINSNHKPLTKKQGKIYEENTFEKKNDYLDPKKCID